jgi:type I restriction enzyme S subunit
MPSETVVEYKLAQVLERIIDYRGKQPAKTATGIQLITAKNIRDGYLDLKGSQEFIAEDQYDDWMVRGIPEPGDVLFTTEAPLGNTALFPRRGRFALAQRVVVLRGKQGALLSEYLLHWLRSPDGRIAIQRLATGSTAKGIKQSTLRKVCIRIPSVKAQEWVAPLLTEWDTQLLAVQAVVKAKRKLKRGLLQQLLTGQRRFPEFRKQPWVEHRLGDLFDERIELGRVDLPLLSITADRGIVPRESIVRSDTSSADKSLYKRIAPGDIGYNTMRMWQGVSALSSLEGIVSPAYTICSPRKGVHGAFFAHLFKFPPVVHRFWRYSQGLVDDTLNLKFHEFSQVRVNVPSDLREQERIATLLDTTDLELAQLRAMYDALKNQKKGLMQKLLTGQIRVPASMLKEASHA